MKLITTFLLATVLILQTHAQQMELAPTTLWKLSGNGLKSDSYILLTGPQCGEESKASKLLEVAFAQVQVISPEYDLYGEEAQALAKDKFPQVDSQGIYGQLSNTEVQSYTASLKEGGLPDKLIDLFLKYKVSGLWYALQLVDGACGITQERLVWETTLKNIY